MVKLSDYLSYLSNEIAQARKGMDLDAIERAKEYSQHEYLKYFKAPRFTMPTIKLELPIKISELESETKYNFKMDREVFLENFNKKISNLEREHNIKVTRFTKDDLEKKEFNNIITELEKKDYKFVQRLDDSISSVTLKQPFKPILAPIQPLRESTLRETLSDEEIQFKVDTAFRETLKEQYTPISSNLKDVFIEPDTNSLKQSGDDKILVKLSVELVEENLQVRKVTDKNGKEYEEIIID